MAFDFLYDAVMMVLAFAGVIAGWEQVRIAHKKNEDFLHMKKKNGSKFNFMNATTDNQRKKKNTAGFTLLNLNELSSPFKKLFTPDILGAFDLEKKVAVILFVEKKRRFAF